MVSNIKHLLPEYDSKNLYSPDEKLLLQQLASLMPELAKEDVQFLMFHVKHFLSKSLDQNKKIEIRKFGRFALRKRKFAFRNKKYRFLYFKGSDHIK